MDCVLLHPCAHALCSFMTAVDKLPTRLLAIGWASKQQLENALCEATKELLSYKVALPAMRRIRSGSVWLRCYKHRQGCDPHAPWFTVVLWNVTVNALCLYDS